jgi:hypothetical protein
MTNITIRLINELRAFFAWLASNPMRARVAMVLVLTVLALALVVFPNVVVVAGQASGGS